MSPAPEASHGGQFVSLSEHAVPYVQQTRHVLESSLARAIDSPTMHLTLMVVSIMMVMLCWFLLCRSRLSEQTRAVVKLVCFVVLHIADYASNIAMMVIIYFAGHDRYLCALVPVHLTIGLFCMYTAATNTDWQNWSCPPVFNLLFMVVVLGLMQGIQVKLAYDDFVRQCAEHSARSATARMPSMMPARYQFKVMDGILEGTVFGFIAMYAVLKRNWTSVHVMVLDDVEAMLLFLAAALSFATAGLALMEVDHRTSAAVQRLLNESPYAQLRHLVFRSSEFSFRILTGLFFCAYTRPSESCWWVAFAIVAADYLFGVMLLATLGGRDPIKEACVLLGMPLLVVNVIQFVDTPGMSLRARRISSIIVPLRALELLGFLLVSAIWMPTVGVMLPDTSEEVTMTFWRFMWELHSDAVIAWIASGIIYCTLYVTYASRIQPEADVHSAVALGDVACLRELICGSELVLDINRYGPDGRTPLHLAALRGHVECMRLLVEEGANLHARTGDRLRNTVLHLAAQSKGPAGMRYLCRISSEDANFLNVGNVEGDTALHIAARRQNVSAIQELLRTPNIALNLKNARHQTAAECAPSDKFGFDRNSPECQVAELLRDAERGIFPQHAPSFEAELPVISSRAEAADGTAAARSLRISATSSSGALSEVSQAGLASEPLTNAALASQHGVPLVAVSSSVEADFLKRNAAGLSSDTMNRSADLVTNCGISSFMLSAGLGALSRVFLSSIHEEAEDTTPVEQSTVKATFEDFTEMSSLGEGAFGKVLLVRQKDTGELFAMKLMDKAKFRAQKITSKAHSEQYILKTTRHPFVVSLHYAFQGSTFWALVMDYCPHGDLQHQLGNIGNPGLPMGASARWGGEVMLALEHLHSIRVIFRDLKLENVVLDAEYRAKVTDFGLAKKLQTTSDARTMCGSYGYAAPEIMLNVSRYTYAVDLYSFGVMLYLMLSGGEASSSNPKQRLPPMKHAGLRKKLREAEKAPRPHWASADYGALELITTLTSEDPRVRGSPEDAKHHHFFWKVLGRSVDSLLKDEHGMGEPMHPRRHENGDHSFQGA